MKSWLYTIYAFVAVVVATVVFNVFARNKKDNDRLASFKRGLDEKKMKIHQAEASAARKKAFEHIKKARQIANKPEPTPKESIDEAISSWNDDNI